MTVLRVVAPPEVALVETERRNYEGQPAVRYQAAAPDIKIFWKTTSHLGDEVWFQEYDE